MGFLLLLHLYIFACVQHRGAGVVWHATVEKLSWLEQT
jgi:hypothetical protein